MPKKNVFVSFDYDNDKDLKELIIGQARLEDSPFDVIDHSLKEEAPMATWEEKARRAIKRSDVVLVMVGTNTYRASGVLKEIEIALEEGVLIVQMIGHKNGDYTIVKKAGRLYSWSWENLKKIFAAI